MASSPSNDAPNSGGGIDAPSKPQHGTTVGSQKSVFELLMSPETPAESSSRYSHEAALHRPVAPYRSPREVSNAEDARRKAARGGGGKRPVDDDLSLGALTRRSLPYFMPWYQTAGPSELPPNFSWLSESCGGKAAIGLFGGGCMGLLMGVFLGAMSDMTPPVTVINGREVPQAPLKEQMRTTMRATAEKSLYWCRNFAFITGVFGGSECLVEKYRGKHDVWNSAISGCVTGAALQAKQGPQAAAFGCGGFAAFSLVIDNIMGTH